MSSKKRSRSDDIDDIWQEHRYLIATLYEKEKKTLKQVKHIMETEHGFPITPLSTYESIMRDRLGLRKKLKRTDWPIVYQHWRKRRSKATGIYLNGVSIPWNKAWKEIRRSGAHSLDQDHGRPLPSGIVLRTPSPIVSPMPLGIETYKGTLLRLPVTPRGSKCTTPISSSRKIVSSVNKEFGVSATESSADSLLFGDALYDPLRDWIQVCLRNVPWNVWASKIYSIMADSTDIEHTSLLNSSITLTGAYSSSFLGTFVDLISFSREPGPHFDSYRFLARAVFLLSNNLIEWPTHPKQSLELFDFLFSRIPRGILLVLLLKDLPSTRATWEKLVCLSKRYNRRHAFSLLMNIGLKNKDWIIPIGHTFLSFAVSFGCLKIVQSLLSIGVRPDTLLTEGTIDGKRFGTAIFEAVAAGNLSCVRLLLRNCDVNRVIYKTYWAEISNFGNFLIQMKDGNQLHLRVLIMFLEIGANVDSIWMWEAFSNFARLHRRTRVPWMWRLSILDRTLYQNPAVHEILMRYSRRAATEITRTGICLAARQGKAKLDLYLNSRPAQDPLALRRFLELILAEQFLFESWEIDTRVVRGLLDFGVNIQLPSLNVDISLLMYRLVVTARLHGSNNDVETIITLLLKQGAVLDDAIIVAAIDDEGLGMLPLLAHFKADIKCHGGHALATAARLDNWEAVSWLVQVGVDVNKGVHRGKEILAVIYLATDDSLPYPSHRSFGEIRRTASASCEMLQYLINCGAKLRKNPDEQNPFSFMTRILISELNDNLLLDRAQLLLDSGVDPSESSGAHAHLLEACVSEKYWIGPKPFKLALFELLFRRGAPIRPGGALALLICHEAPIKLVDEVLEAGADIHAYSGYHGHLRLTPLQAAAMQRDQKLVSKLLRRGANINSPAVGWRGRTALQAACEWNALSVDEECRRKDLIRFLVSHGADINARASDEYGLTALQIAARHGDIELALLLLDHGADPNAVPSKTERLNALDAAAEFGRLDMVQLLLNVGARSHRQGRTGYKGAIQAAEQSGHSTVADLLRHHAMNVTGMSDIGHVSEDQEDYMEDGSMDCDESSDESF